MLQYNEGDLVYVEYTSAESKGHYFSKVKGIDIEANKVVLDDVLIVYDNAGDDLVENYKLEPEFIIENFKSTPIEEVKISRPDLFV